MIFHSILRDTHSLTLSFLFTSQKTLILANFLLNLTLTLTHQHIQTGVTPNICLRLQCHPPNPNRGYEY